MTKFGHVCMYVQKVAGYAIGGGHILHMVCDLTIAADNAIFGQTGPKVLSMRLIDEIDSITVVRTDFGWNN